MFFLLRISRLNRPFWCITWFWGVPFCFRTTSVGFSIESWTLARLLGNFYRSLVQTKSLFQGLTGLALWSISVNAFWSAQSRRRSNTRKSKLGSSQYDRVNSTKDQKDRHALSMHKLDAFLKGSESGQNGWFFKLSKQLLTKKYERLKSCDPDELQLLVLFYRTSEELLFLHRTQHA